ncbi:hypothetical protein RS030_162411 [Cryptosporidium xiaoi]|uniref:SUN domain-containing protein n=1 Tax=Cryptosporidium xiaoi TaxID=659607 RepID=A0AAV9Y1N1_9CRYT
MTKCNELLFILLLLVCKSILCEKRLNAERFNDTKSVCHNYDIQSEAIREELNKKNSIGINFNENNVFNTIKLNANHVNKGIDGNIVYAESSEIVMSKHGKRTVEDILVDLDRLKIRKYYTNLNSSDCRISILKRRGNLRIPRDTIYMMRSFDRILELLDILSSRRECPYCKGCNDIRLGSLPIWVSPIFQKQLKRINYELDYKLCYILKKDLRVYNEIKETILKLRDNFWDVEKNGNKRTLYDLSPIEDNTIEIIRKNNIKSFNVSILGIILELKFDDLKLVGSKLNHCVPLQFLFKCSWHPNKQSKDILSKLNFVSNIMFDISNSLEINLRIDNVDGTKTRTKTDGVDIYDYKYDVNIEDEININSNLNFVNNTHFGSNNNKGGEVRNINAGNDLKNTVSGLDLFYIQFGNPNITGFEDVFIPNRSKTKASAFSKSSFTYSFSNKNSNLFGYREYSSISDSLPSASSHSATISSSLSSSSPSSSASPESSSYSVNSLLISSNKCISPFLDTMVVPKEGFLGNGELQICDFELGTNLDDGGEITNNVKDKRSSGLKEGNTKTNNFGKKKTTGPYNDYESQYYDDEEDEYGEKLRVVHGIQYVHHIAAIQYDYASSSSNSKLLAWGDGIMHPKSVQSSNPDSYLLVPCNKPMWFIIGFQEDIFLEFISIFSLEYFSSSYKDIEISGSLVYPTKNWVSIGILRRNEKLSKEMFDMKPLCMREEDTDEGRRRERTFEDVNYMGGSNLNEKKKSDIIKENINTKSGQSEYKESTLNGYKNKKQKKYNLQSVEKKPDGKRNVNSNNIKDVVKDGDSLGSDGGKYEYPFSSTYSHSHSYSNPCWVRYIRVRALSNFEEGHYYCHLSRIQIFGNNIINKLEAEINGKRNSILIRGDGEESVKEVENRLLKRDPNIINGNIQDQKDDPDHRNNDNTHDRRNDNRNKVDLVGNNGIEGGNGNQNGYLNRNNHYYSPHYYNHIDNKVNTDNYGRSQNYNGKQENKPEAEAAYGDSLNTGNVDNNEFLGVKSNYGSDNNRDRNIKQKKQKEEEAFSYNEKNRYRYAYNNNEFENEMYPNMDFYRTQDINYRNNHPLLSFVEKVKMLEKKINLLKMENRAILSELNSTTSYITESMRKLSDSIKFLQDVLMLDSNYNITSVGEDVRVSDKTGINRGVIGRVGAINKSSNIGSGLNRGIRFDNIGIAFKNTLNQYYDNYFNIECLIKVLKNINSLILIVLRYIIDNITILVLLLLIVTLVTSQVFLYKQLFSVKKRLQNTLQFIKSYSNNSTPTAKNSKGGVILDDPFSFQKNTKLHSNPVGINLNRGFNAQTSVNSGTKPQNNHTNYITPSVVSIPSSTIENNTATICGAKVGVNPINSNGGNKGSGNEFGTNFDPSYIIKDPRDSHCESDDCNCVLPTENNQVSANTSIGDNSNPENFIAKTEYEEAFGEGKDQAIKEELPEGGGDSGEVGGESKNNAKCNHFSVLANDVQKNDDINSIQS